VRGEGMGDTESVSEGDDMWRIKLVENVEVTE
jgi:hypothetical protein